MSYRFAIVGCGNVSRRHVAAIQQFGTLAAACDLEMSRAEALTDGKAAAFSNIREMLRKIKPDVVSVCTPAGTHPDHVSEALEGGAHVLCEKPLAISSEAGYRMIETASAAGKKLFVVKQNRFNPVVMEVKNLVDNRSLGKVMHFHVNCIWNRNEAYYRAAPWRGTSAMDGGILFTQFSHFIDILYWFCGGISTSTGWRTNFRHKELLEFEDTGAARLFMKNGSAGNIYYTINAEPGHVEGSITLFGEKGTIKIGGPYLNRLEHFAVEGQTTSPITKDYNANTDFHQAVYRELVRSIELPQHSLVDAMEAMKSVEMIEEIYRASPMIV